MDYTNQIESMIKKNISEIFASVITECKEVIKLKSVICSVNIPNPPLQLFRLLDSSHKNYVSLQDIKFFLSKNRLIFPSFFLKEIFSPFDEDMDECLNLEEFGNFLLEEVKFYGEDRGTKGGLEGKLGLGALEGERRVVNFHSNCLIYQREVEKMLVELVKTYMKLYKAIGIKMKKFKENTRKFNMEIKGVFHLISGGKSSVGKEELLEFLNGNLEEKKVNEGECAVLIKLISKRKERFSLKSFERLLNFDRYIDDKETEYIKPEGYYDVNTIDDTRCLYYDIYKSKKSKGNKGSDKGSLYTFANEEVGK